MRGRGDELVPGGREDLPGSAAVSLGADLLERVRALAVTTEPDPVGRVRLVPRLARGTRLAPRGAHLAKPHTRAMDGVPRPVGADAAVGERARRADERNRGEERGRDLDTHQQTF